MGICSWTTGLLNYNSLVPNKGNELREMKGWFYLFDSWLHVQAKRSYQLPKSISSVGSMAKMWLEVIFYCSLIPYIYAMFRWPSFRNLVCSLHSAPCLQLKDCFDKYAYYTEIHFLRLIEWQVENPLSSS